MSQNQQHTCSYHCEHQECIRRQRDELRERLARQRPILWVLRDNINISTTRAPLDPGPWMALGEVV